MAVFYKYVERQASDQIDWGAISKTMSDTLDAENKRRDEKKQAIDDASRKYINELQNQPESESADVNAIYGQLANDGAAAQKMFLDNLKSGRMSLKDYTIRTQNLQDDTAVTLDLAKVYNDRYKEVMEGINSEKLSAANAELMAQYEGFANLKNNKLWVDPTSGRIYAGDIVMGTDGVKTMGKNVRNVSALKQTMQQDILRFNADSELNTRVEKLGGFVTESIKSGGLYRIGAEIKFKDATQQQYYDQYKKDLTEEFIGGPNNPRAISFFVDNMRLAPSGKPYRLVSKKEDAKGPEDILIQQNANGQNMPVLTEQQMKDAEGWITVQMRQKIERSTEKQSLTIPERPQPSDDANKNTKNDKNLAGMVLLLKHGTVERKKAAISGLESTEGMKGFRFKFTTDNKLLVENVTDPSKKSQPIDLNLSDKDFVGALAQATGISDVNKALKGAYEAYPEFKGRGGFVPMGSYTSQKSDLTNMQKFSQISTSLLPSTVSTDDSQFVKDFNASDLVLKYGYEIDNPTNFNPDDITITSPPVYDENGKLLRDGRKITIDLKTDRNPKETISKFIKSNPPSDYKLKEASEDLNSVWQTKNQGGGELD